MVALVKLHTEDGTDWATWALLHPRATAEHLGHLVEFLAVSDPRPVREQINERYAHGGGWRPSNPKYWRVSADQQRLTYDGKGEEPDEHFGVIASCLVREELVILFENSWVGIFQKDGTFEIARMD